MRESRNRETPVVQNWHIVKILQDLESLLELCNPTVIWNSKSDILVAFSG